MLMYIQGWKEHNSIAESELRIAELFGECVECKADDPFQRMMEQVKISGIVIRQVTEIGLKMSDFFSKIAIA
jgi:hypothetical protein